MFSMSSGLGASRSPALTIACFLASALLVSSLQDELLYKDAPLTRRQPKQGAYSLSAQVSEERGSASLGSILSVGSGKMGLYALFGLSSGGTIVFGLMIIGYIVMSRDNKDYGFGPGWGEALDWDDVGKGKGKGKDKGKMKGKGKGKGKKGKDESEEAGEEAAAPEAAPAPAPEAAPAPTAQPKAKASLAPKNLGAGLMGGLNAATGVAANATGIGGVKGDGAAAAESDQPVEEAAPPSKVEKDGARNPTEASKIEIVVEVKSGTNMPSVNTFGGCDPFVEIACVLGDPNIAHEIQTKTGRYAETGAETTIEEQMAKRNAAYTSDLCTARTKSRDGELSPVWNESLTLSKCVFGPDHSKTMEHFIKIILWDANVASNMPIGWQAISTKLLLGDVQYDPKADVPFKKDFKAENFISSLPDAGMAQATVVKAAVSLSFSYVETHKFVIKIKKASHLPKVDTLGSIDAFIEVRLVTVPPMNMEYQKSPGSETLWSSKTKTINDNMDPKWNEDLTFTHAARPGMYLLFCVTDANTVSNTPIGMICVPLKDVMINKNGVAQDFKSKMTKLPNWPPPPNLNKATVSFSITHELAMDH